MVTSSSRLRLAAGSALLHLLLIGCSRPADPAAAAAAKSALTVCLISPVTEVWPEELEVSGRVEPWQEAVVSSEINGFKLEEVLADTGDQVTKGQLLARFGDETIRARLAEMEAEVHVREANLATSADQLSRSRRLVASGAVSEQTHRQNEATVAGHEADLASARARLAAQQLELRYTRVTAQDDGVISSRTATTGTVLATGQELFRLIRQGRLEWRAEIPDRLAAHLTPGLPATLNLQDDGNLHGTIRQISPVVDPRLLTAICYIDLPAPGPAKAGMHARGTILIGESPALHVPESAIVYRDGYTYVIRIGPDLTAHPVKVATGRRRDRSVEIRGSVTIADRLILSGGSFVNEGDPVKVVPSPEEATAREGGDR